MTSQKIPNSTQRLTRTIAAAALLAILCPSPTVAQTLEAEPFSNDRSGLYDALATEAMALEHQSSLLKKVVKVIKPTVVHIEAKKKEGGNVRYPGRGSVEEAGSGVIIELGDAHYVLTNRHVIKNSQLSEITIRLADGRQIHPRRVWTDLGTDVAVIDVSASELIPARLGDSDQIEIGDFVVAVGSPFGLSHSVTFGIVSAKGRRDLELGSDGVRYQNFIQTDAAINPGNSGGPLMNLRGEVIGINTAIASNSGGNEGIGFSIPINMVMFISRQLVDRGTVVRAYLGVRLDYEFGPTQAARLGLPRPIGARIKGITPGSPAESAQLRAGDVIVKFNNVHVEDDTHLVNLVSLTQVEQEVALVVYRDGKTVTMKATVADRNTFEPRG